MIKLAYLLYLFSFQLGSLNVQSFLSFPRRHHKTMTTSRVYTMRSRDEEWYSQINLAAIQTEETQGKFAIKYKELFPMEYAVRLDDSDWDALSHQNTFDAFVCGDLRIPENERNISVVWKFLKIPTVDWYIGYSHLKSLAVEHNTSPIIGPWLKIEHAEFKIMSAIKRFKTIPSSVISEESFDEFVLETMKIPQEEQDSRVWAFLQSLNLLLKFRELYVLLTLGAARDKGGVHFEESIYLLDLFNIRRYVYDEEDWRNWGYLSQEYQHTYSSSNNSMANETRRLRELVDLFSLPMLNETDEFNKLVSKYVNPDKQDKRVLPFVQKMFNYSLTTSSASSSTKSSTNVVLVSAYNWYSQIKMAAGRTNNDAPTGNYKELLKGPKGFPLPTKTETAFDNFVTNTLKIPRNEQDSRVWGFIQNPHKAKKPILQGSNVVATTSLPPTTTVVATSE